MIPNLLHSHPQPTQSLYCSQHGEPVKGICFFNGKCEDRLMCRICRKNHDSNHLNFYEELEDLLHGDLIDDLKMYLESIIKNLDNQKSSYENNTELLVGQIDYLIKEIQGSILKKLTQTKDLLIENANKKNQKNNTLKQQLSTDLNNMVTSFDRAINSKFTPPSTAEDMVQAICKAQALRENLENDPEVQALQVVDLSVSSSTIHSAAEAFQMIKISLDNICQEIENNFVSNPVKNASIPKGKLLQGNPMMRQHLHDNQNAMAFEGRQRAPFLNSNTPIKDPFTFGHTNRGLNVQNPNISMMQEEGSNQPYKNIRKQSYGKGIREGRDLRDRGNKSPRSFSPQKIFEIFEMVNQEEAKRGAQARNQGPNRSVGKQSQVNFLLAKLKEVQRNEGQPNFSKQEDIKGIRKQTNFRRGNQLIEYRDKTTTVHQGMLFGSLAYMPEKEQLITAGIEGSLEIIDINTMESVYSFKAHASEIFRILYIQEKGLLLSAGREGEINVWDSKQKFKLLHTYKRHNGAVYALEIFDDSDIILSGGEDRILRMWNVNTGKETGTMGMGELRIGAICNLGKSKKVAVGFDKGHINIVTIKDIKKVAYSIPGHRDHYIQNLVFVEEQNLLFSSADDEYVKVWRLFETKGECVRRFSQENTIVRSFLVFMEKDILMTNHDDSQLRVWDLSSGKKLDEFHDETFGENMVSLENRDEVATANLKDVKFWILN